MCEFLSFLISADGKKMACGDLRSHFKSREVLKLDAKDWRECEWVADNDAGLSVRVAPGDNHDEKYYKACVLGEYPTRLKCVMAMVQKVDAGGGRIDVSGYAQLTKLDAPNGTYVNARGCTKLTKATNK